MKRIHQNAKSCHKWWSFHEWITSESTSQCIIILTSCTIYWHCYCYALAYASYWLLLCNHLTDPLRMLLRGYLSNLLLIIIAHKFLSNLLTLMHLRNCMCDLLMFLPMHNHLSGMIIMLLLRNHLLNLTMKLLWNYL